MREREGFISVDEKTFYDFLKDKKVERQQGEWFHSEYYVDENNEKIAYMESSSWSMHVIYEIKSELSQKNWDTLNFIGKLIR